MTGLALYDCVVLKVVTVFWVCMSYSILVFFFKMCFHALTKYCFLNMKDAAGEQFLYGIHQQSTVIKTIKP